MALALPGGGPLRVALRISDWAQGISPGHVHRLVEHLGHLGLRLDGTLDEHGLLLVALVAAATAALDFIEAAGLHFRRRWAAWLTVAATALLLPFEIYSFWQRPRIPAALFFTANVLVVVYLSSRARRDSSIWSA